MRFVVVEGYRGVGGVKLGMVALRCEFVVVMNERGYRNGICVNDGNYVVY